MSASLVVDGSSQPGTQRVRIAPMHAPGRSTTTAPPPASSLPPTTSPRPSQPTTTTTVAPPASTVAPSVTKGQAGGNSTVNGYPCGGDLPSCCTLRRESGGDPYAVEPGHRGAPFGDPGDPAHHASGLWQFMPSTWAGYGGYPYAAAAPAQVQNERARQVFAHGAGASNWYGDGCYGGR